MRRTVRIAIVVGIILTLINQGSVIAAGHATAAIWVRCVLNFIVPFLVSNAGLRRPGARTNPGVGARGSAKLAGAESLPDRGV